MLTPEQQERKDAVRALVNIAILESLILIAVVAVYLATGVVAYLVGGVLGTLAIFVPFYVRWARDYAKALKGKPNSAKERQA